MNITCDQLKVDDRAIINCIANDKSDAPALGVYVSVPGLIDQYYLQFAETDIPAVGLPLVPVNVSLYEVSAAHYNLYMDSANMIDNASVLSESYYIPGRHFANQDISHNELYFYKILYFTKIIIASFCDLKLFFLSFFLSFLQVTLLVPSLMLLTPQSWKVIVFPSYAVHLQNFKTIQLISLY